VSLSNLPADDWPRVKNAFVAKIGALGSVTLLARIGSPLTQRLDEADSATHRHVPVPLSLLFNLDEVGSQYFHVVRGALLPNGAIDRCSHCRDRRLRRRGGGREVDDEDDVEDEEDGAPPTPPVVSVAAASATRQRLPQHPPRTPTAG
jgi:hypothetical protein